MLPLWREYQRMLAEDQPYTFLFYPRHVGAARYRLAPAASPAGHCHVVQPGVGARLTFCDSPELRATVLVDSVSAGSTRLAAGTAELDTSNFGTHRDEDELIYFLRGTGRAVIGQDTFTVRAGTTMYVPRGTRHGFFNTVAGPLEFFWVVSPAGLAARFRAGALPPGARCDAAPA